MTWRDFLVANAHAGLVVGTLWILENALIGMGLSLGGDVNPWVIRAVWIVVGFRFGMSWAVQK